MCREDLVEARICSWKGAAVHRGLVKESREIAIVRSPYQETGSGNTSGWKGLSLYCSDW
jgi:hypothetical protein